MMQLIWRHSRAIWLNRHWRRAIVIAMTALSFGLLIWGLLRDWRNLARYDWQFNWLSLLLSVPAYLVAMFFVVWGWRVIMRTLHVGSSWRQDARFFIYSWIARRLPTPGPYFASRVLLYEQAGVPKRITSLGLMWENLSMVASGALVALLLLPVTPMIGSYAAALPILLVTATSLVVVMRPLLLNRFFNWLLRRIGRQPLDLPISTRSALLVLLIYAAGWLAGGIILFFLIRATYPLDWSAMPLIAQSWVLSGLASHLAFFAPVGFGIRDLTLAALLALVIPFSVAVVIVLLVRVWFMVNELFWALVLSRL